MTAAVLHCATSPPALAAPPEPVDAEFLDYLGTVEGKDDNWTVVASERERKKVAERKPVSKEPPDKVVKPTEEKKP
jgi:hypothetical protein